MKKFISHISAPVLLASLVLALLAGCSPFALVNSETYNDADLASYKTFRIVTPDMGHLPPGMQMVTYYNIAAAVRQQMVIRGYTEDPDSPLLINLAVTTKTDVTTGPLYQPGYFPYNGPYYPYYIWPRGNYGPYWAPPVPPAVNPNAQVITGIYKEGVLTMDFVNIDTKVPLYSASVATIINGSNGQYRNLKSIAEAVATLFSRFPVKPLPQYDHD